MATIRGRSRDTEGLREHGMMMDEQDRESEAGLTSNEQTSPGGDGVRPLSPDEQREADAHRIPFLCASDTHISRATARHVDLVPRSGAVDEFG